MTEHPPPSGRPRAAFDASRQWDVIIVGSGMGGGTLAHALVRQGLDVLLLEKGGRVPPRIDQAERTAPAERMERGWWPMPVSQETQRGGDSRFFAAVGCAVGGSTIHYAAALERLAPTDFESAAGGGAPAWPVGYEEFTPWYAAAEQLYRVQSSPDAALPRLSEWDRGIMAQLRSKGLRPDVLRVAIRYDGQCEECIGRICPRGCKADALSVCIADIEGRSNFQLLEHCDVRTITGSGNRATGVRAVHDGREIDIRGRVVVLSAGAFRSPLILLRSRGEGCPEGLAAGSDQVGRNLMFHTADIYAIWAPRRLDRRGRQKKAVSVRDFYLCDDGRLGYVQSLGVDVGRGAVAAHLKNILRRRGVRNEWLLSALVKIPSHIGSALLGSAVLFSAMTEDDPDPRNRVMPDPEHPDGIRFTYTITDDLRRRADLLFARFAAAIRPWRVSRMSAGLAMNYGHPCGTCRFGDDPASSVLDRDCRVHGLDNLFVVDASFMPRSGAVNPSLTIAANALRVAPRIAEVAAAGAGRGGAEQ